MVIVIEHDMDFVKKIAHKVTKDPRRVVEKVQN
jgi:ABC-type uncharacterized transport system ATPase subunit